MGGKIVVESLPRLLTRYSSISKFSPCFRINYNNNNNGIIITSIKKSQLYVSQIEYRKMFRIVAVIN